MKQPISPRIRTTHAPADGFSPTVFLFARPGMARSSKCLHVMKTLDRSVLYKTVAAVVLSATGGWIWLLYILAKWMVQSVHSL